MKLRAKGVPMIQIDLCFQVNAIGAVTKKEVLDLFHNCFLKDSKRKLVFQVHCRSFIFVKSSALLKHQNKLFLMKVQPWSSAVSVWLRFEGSRFEAGPNHHW